jgi:DNA-binding transcriptional regulator YdaS (Cro superfamily)
MEALRTYLKSLTPAEQSRFAKRCGTSIGYLRKALSREHKLGDSLVIKIERESAGAVPVEKLRPDIDWAYLRGSSLSTTKRKAG